MSKKGINAFQSEVILSAAYNCIATQGCANTSLWDIAESAGVVLSQLNYYYKNKEGLFIEVIKMMINKYRAEVESRIQLDETAIVSKEMLATSKKQTMKVSISF